MGFAMAVEIRTEKKKRAAEEVFILAILKFLSVEWQV